LSISKTVSLLAILFCLMTHHKPLQELFEDLPGTVLDWKKSDPCQFYDPDTLFDYINGGAELYLSYGFKRLLSCRYQSAKHSDITVDIFDMGHSYRAFGVFSHSRESVDDSIGQGCEYGGGLMIFWKGRYYVSIMAYPETGKSRQSVFQIARILAGSIPDEGPLPPILELIPRKGLIRESIRYFRHYIWLNSHYFISNRNILHIDERAEAVLARYSRKQGKHFLLLVVYPDEEKARDAQKSFKKEYLKDSDLDTGQVGQNNWAGSRIDGNRLWMIFKAGSRQMINNLFGELSDGFKNGLKP
jgi:hypothetical protein